MNLRQRLFLLGLSSLLPAAAVIGYLQFELRSARQEEAYALVARQTQQANAEIQRLVEGMKTLLTAVAAVPSVQARDHAACSVFLERLVLGLPHVQGVAVLNLDGDLLCTDSAVKGPLNYGDRDYFKQVVATGAFVLGSYTVSRRDPPEATLPFAMPVRDRTGKAFGIVVAGLDLPYLNSELQNWALDRGSALTIADRNGVILARNPMPERFVGTRIPEQFQGWVHADRPGTEEARSQDGTWRIISYIPATAYPTGLYLSTGVSRDVVFGYVDDTTHISLISMAIGIGLMLIVIYFAGRYFIQQPVDRLLSLAEGWSLDPPRPPATSADGGEFGEITKALNRMGEAFVAQRARELEQQARLKVLLKELNHRVKNTLAVVQAIVGQGLRGSDSNAETRAKIEARLLALARSHDLLTQDNWAGSSVRDLVVKTLEPFGAITDRASRFQLSGVEVQLSPKLTLSLGMALHELATNATKYGALSTEEGTVSVTWTLRNDGPDDRVLLLRWQEAGGPPVTPPSRKGFGSRLIENSVGRGKGSRVDLVFHQTGVECTIELPIGQDASVHA